MQALMYGRKADGSAEPIAIENDGSVKVSGGAGGGGGGDASAANQLTEIARLEAIRDRLPTSLGAKASAAALAAVTTPFEPTAGSTVSHSVGTTALTAVACTPGTVIRFGNAGAAAIGIRFGSSTVAADITAATAMDIMPGTAEAITVPAGATHWSAIMSSGTGTLKTTLGLGS